MGKINKGVMLGIITIIFLSMVLVFANNWTEFMYGTIPEPTPTPEPDTELIQCIEQKFIDGDFKLYLNIFLKRSGTSIKTWECGDINITYYGYNEEFIIELDNREITLTDHENVRLSEIIKDELDREQQTLRDKLKSTCGTNQKQNI